VLEPTAEFLARYYRISEVTAQELIAELTDPKSLQGLAGQARALTPPEPEEFKCSDERVRVLRGSASITGPLDAMQQTESLEGGHVTANGGTVISSKRTLLL